MCVCVCVCVCVCIKRVIMIMLPKTLRFMYGEYVRLSHEELLIWAVGLYSDLFNRARAHTHTHTHTHTYIYIFTNPFHSGRI